MSEPSDPTGQGWSLWWIGVSVVVGFAVYAAFAPNWLAFGLAALLGAVAVLHYHDRLIKVDTTNRIRKSVVFALLVTTLLVVARAVGVSLINAN